MKRQKLKRFNIAMDDYFVREIDKAAKALDISRSQYIRQAVRWYLEERRKLLTVDATAMSDEEVKEAFDRIRREHAGRQDHEWRRQLKREGH